jgi:hypothetical protein
MTNSNSPYTPLELPLIPSPFLYHNKSREQPHGIDNKNSTGAKSLAIGCGQEPHEPDFKSYKATPMSLNEGIGQTFALQTTILRLILNNEHEFISAALPDMSWAIPARASTVASPDSEYTRAYLTPPDKAAEH